MTRAGGASPLSFRVARLLLTAAAGGAGYLLGNVLLGNGLLTGPNTLLYLTLLGLLLGYLVSPLPARWWARTWEHLAGAAADTPPEGVLAAGTGATLALLVTVLLNNLLAAVPGFTWYWSLLIALVLVTLTSWFFVVNRQLFDLPTRDLRQEGVPAEAGAKESRLKIVDTSALIDGRLVEVAEAHFLDGAVLIPQFVLGELQAIADSEDPLRRRRGRRGLEMLDRLIQGGRVTAQILPDEASEGDEVDQRLVQLCLGRQADLITTDYNLNRVASLQGIRVLNVNQLANAVKAMFLPGERLALHIVRPGREQGQGLAYLEDGTMVVVEDAGDKLGQTIQTVVTSNLQTNMGRMIFARPEESA